MTNLRFVITGGPGTGKTTTLLLDSEVLDLLYPLSCFRSCTVLSRASKEMTSRDIIDLVGLISVDLPLLKYYWAYIYRCDGGQISPHNSERGVLHCIARPTLLLE